MELEQNREKTRDEVFTPNDLMNIMLDKLPNNIFTDFSKTFLEPSAGNGNFVIAILNRRLNSCYNISDISHALETIYAVELMQDNVDEMKQRMLDTCFEKYKDLHIKSIISPIPIWQKIINTNIVCSDFFKWDFENWRPIKETTSVELF